MSVSLRREGEISCVVCAGKWREPRVQVGPLRKKLKAEAAGKGDPTALCRAVT